METRRAASVTLKQQLKVDMKIIREKIRALIFFPPPLKTEKNVGGLERTQVTSENDAISQSSISFFCFEGGRRDIHARRARDREINNDILFAWLYHGLVSQTDR
ncbi:hypothetical protein OUZ56_008123 [Daphnia magna]|uniref:Uncharacterized protein n=1 Tax=Daphnia magna TaxID=35525 RepID=A0ABR0AC14_9CRUS|nr:hypothetical protein OUZ56_008123 [Daphnia magna]